MDDDKKFLSWIEYASITLKQLQTDDNLTDVTLGIKDDLNLQQKNTCDGTLSTTEATHSIHKDMTCSCDQCDYKANQHNQHLAHHQSKLEVATYQCDQCDYKDTGRYVLGNTNNPNTKFSHIAVTSVSTLQPSIVFLEVTSNPNT